MVSGNEVDDSGSSGGGTYLANVYIQVQGLSTVPGPFIHIIFCFCPSYPYYHIIIYKT